MEWKDIVGYEGYYQVSENGDIKSLRTPDKLRKVYTPEYGHKTIALNKAGWELTHTIHRLVYEAFVGEIPKDYVVHHKDENPQNNHFSNLEIMQHEKHVSLHVAGEKQWLSKFSAEEISNIRDRSSRESVEDIADSLNVSYSTINRIVRYKTYKK
jgi:hypothetical protein